jgi:opacity protein-like surface antigen
MRASKTLFAGLFLLTGAALAASPASGQDIDVPPGYQPADSYQTPPPADDSFQRHTAGLRGSLAFKGSATTPVPSVPTTRTTSHAIGGGGSLYFGQRLPLNLTVELEGLYRYLPINQVSLGGAGTGGSGNVQVGAPMLNLMWNMPVDDFWLKPFVGMGVGAAFVSSDIRDGSGARVLRKDKWSLAYDFMAGANLPLTDSSRFTMMYRWLKLNDLGYRCAANAGFSNPCRTDMDNSSVDLGLEMDL